MYMDVSVPRTISRVSVVVGISGDGIWVSFINSSPSSSMGGSSKIIDSCCFASLMASFNMTRTAFASASSWSATSSTRRLLSLNKDLRRNGVEMSRLVHLKTMVEMRRLISSMTGLNSLFSSSQTRPSLSSPFVLFVPRLSG